MRLRLLLFIFIICPAYIIGAALFPRGENVSWIPFDTTKYQGHTTLTTPSNLNIELFWKIDNASNEITFGVASNNGPTWVGIGVSQNGGMKGADIVAGYVSSTSVSKNGKFFLNS